MNTDDLGIRLKTEGAFVERPNEVNLEKYGEHLKNELSQISKLLSKKKAFQKEEDSPGTNFKKNSGYGTGIQSARTISKNVKQELQQSIVRKSKEQQEQNRRKHIYATQSWKDEEQKLITSKLVDSQKGRPDKIKARFSETVSTASSHIQDRDPDMKGFKLSISDFSIGKKLGEGKFGEVFVAQHRISGFVCAIKRIHKSKLDEKMTMQLVREIKIQSFLNHPNIVRLYTFFSDIKSIYLVQELCYSGELYSFLKKKKKVPEDLARVIVQQISRALDYMHQCEIIHRDVKPENIIYHNGLVKICDFGWSISSKAMRETFCGTPLYIPPELLKRKSYNNKIDVWGLGILAYQLLLGRVPFEIVSEKDFLKIIEDEIRFSKTTYLSEEGKEFISICLCKDPRDRYTIPELLEHPWVSRIENPILGQLY